MKEFLKYFVVGAGAACVDIGLFTVLATVVGIGYVPANVVALTAGMIFNYWLSCIWVFEQKKINVRRDFLPFAAIGIVGLVIQCVLLYGLIDLGFTASCMSFLTYLTGITVGMPFILFASKVFAVGVTFLWNFFVRKYLVFHRTENAEPEDHLTIFTDEPRHEAAASVSFTINRQPPRILGKDSHMKKVVIMGAGPAGLAAGYELAKHGVQPTLFESDTQVGGISKTVQHHGNYFDLGGHRFFTKLDPVNELWQEVLGEKFMKRPRQSRIYYNNKFFNYPLTALNALMRVGLLDTAKILCSFGAAQLFPSKTEDTFEDWVSNRFGKRLFSIFFKTYTEKVWGIPCSEIQAEWAAQRIKGLSLYSAIINALFKPKGNKIKTLIDEFDYPEFGPGMMYTEMKSRIEQMGGSVQMRQRVVGVRHDSRKVTAVEFENENGERELRQGTDFLSSIPITELVRIMSPTAPEEVLRAADSLKYRSLVTVDITVNQKELFPDNWIYIHSPEVKLGRIQNFKNWSPSMVADPSKTTLGLEYFCDEGDDFWKMDDQKMFELAAEEVSKIKICKRNRIEDYLVVRVPKAMPFKVTFSNFSSRIFLLSVP